MREFNIPVGSENDDSVCPFCGFVENTRPKILYHLFPGTILNNRYIIGIVLGSGGFGVTYKAWDSVLGIVVAIKEYYPTAFVQRVPGTKDVIVYDGNKRKEYQDSLERFMEEARNTALFDNPNIVHVDNYFEENNTAYIVMEFLDGVSLKDYLKMNGDKIDIADVDYIFDPIMDALKAIHRKNIIHRDISPDNIFLCDHGNVKLIDFGAARFSDNEKEKTRSIILKPGYAPPEQYQSKSIQGAWTDIYALAATLYRVVTGKDPVESVNRFSEEFVKKKDLLVEPKVYLPEMPDQLNNTIMKGMSIEPALRFQTVEEFENAFNGVTKVKNPYEERKRRLIRRAIGIASIAILIAVGALIASNMYSDKKKLVELEPADITMWIPYSDITEDEAQEYGERITADFLNDYSQVNIEVTVIPSDEYEQKIEEAAASNSLPTLFVSDNVSDDVMKNTITVEGVFNYIELSDLDYYDGYKESLKNEKWIPTGYYLPVVYVRQTNDVDMKNMVVSKFDDVRNANGYYVDEKYAAITAKTINVSEEYLLKERASSSDVLADFADGKITYYLATTREYEKVKEAASGKFEVRPYSANIIYGDFCDCWSINASSGENQQIAAEVIIAYLLMDSAQTQKLLEHYSYDFPFNKTTYTSFLNTYGKLKIVENYDNVRLGTLRYDLSEKRKSGVNMVLILTLAAVAVVAVFVTVIIVRVRSKR